MAKRSIVVIDPPWFHKAWGKNGDGRSAQLHYDCMKDQELLDLKDPMQKAFPGDSLICLWVTAPHLKFGIEMLEHWGWEYKTVLLTWVKLIPQYIRRMKNNMATNNNVPMTDPEYLQSLEKLLFTGLGHYTRANNEYDLIAKRGKEPIQRLRKSIHSTILAPKAAHSVKPDEANRRIEALLRRPGDEMFELFARREYSDWLCTGLELDKLDIHEALDRISKEQRWYPEVMRSIVDNRNIKSIEEKLSIATKNFIDLSVKEFWNG